MPKAKKIVEVYQSRAKSRDWRWRLVASNGKIIAASSEGFSSKATAKRNIQSVKTALEAAEIMVKEPKKAPRTTAKTAKTAKPAKVTKPAVKSTKPRTEKISAPKSTVTKLAKAVKPSYTNTGKLRKSKSTADLKVVA